MSDVQIHEAGEWSAVYLNGKLVRVGDSYLADEWVREHFGVATVQDDAFMRGQTSRDGVAQNLGEVRVYRESRDKQLSAAAELRQQAADLLEKP